MGVTVHPHSLTARGSVAAVSACASSTIRINPACIAKPAAAVAKKPKRPGSFHGGDPPAKRARGACGKVEPDASAKINRRPRPSSEEEGRPAGSLRKGVEAPGVTKNQAIASPILLPEVAAPPKSPALNMRELLERAHLAKARSAAPAADADAEAVRRREIERWRAEARRKIDQVVRTVEFNDPFIDLQDAFK